MPASMVPMTETADAPRPTTNGLPEPSGNGAEPRSDAPVRTAPRSRRATPPAPPPPPLMPTEAANGHYTNGNGNGSLPPVVAATLPPREIERMQRGIAEISEAVQRIVKIQAVLTGEIRSAADASEKRAAEFLEAARDSVAETRDLGEEIRGAVTALRTTEAGQAGPVTAVLPETALLLAERTEEMRQAVALLAARMEEQAVALQTLAQTQADAASQTPPAIDTGAITAPLASLTQAAERLNAQQASQNQATTIALHRITAGSERIERQVVEMNDRMQFLHGQSHGEVTEALEELKAGLLDVEREIVQSPQRQKQIIEEAFAMDLRRLQARVEEVAESGGVQAQRLVGEVRSALKGLDDGLRTAMEQETFSVSGKLVGQASQIGARLDSLTKEVRLSGEVSQRQTRIQTALLAVAALFAALGAAGSLLFRH